MNTIMAVVFLIFMLCLHVPVAWEWQRRMLHGVDEVRRQSIRRDLRGYWIRLVIAQIAVLIGIASWLLLLLLSADLLQNGQLQTESRRIAFFGFHAMWWPFVFPLFLRLDKSLRDHKVLAAANEPGPVRTASLRPRRVSDYLPRWSTPFEVALVVAGVSTMVARAIAVPDPSSPVLWGAGMFAFLAVAFIVGYSFWIRTEVQLSYRWLQATATDEEIETHRRFRIRMIFYLQIAAALTLLAAAGMGVEVARGTISGATAGLIGGVAGTVLGIGGALAGITAGLRAAKLQRARQFREQ